MNDFVPQLRPLKPDVLAYFGLRRDPFAKLQRAAEYYQSSEFRTAVKMIRYAVEHDEVVAIVGDIGTGKTDAVAMAAEALGGDPAERIDFVRLAQPDKSGLRVTHVLDALLHHFERDAHAPQSAQKKAWLVRHCLTQAHRDGRRVCLLLDEAHRAPGPFLKGLKELHEGMRFGLRSSLFAVVLIGHRELSEHYARVARDVYDRLSAGNTALLGRMTPREVSAYIAHRLEAVCPGRAGGPLIDEPARLAIGRLACAPLAINELCWRLLEAAYADDLQTIGEERVLALWDRAGLREHLGLSLQTIADRAGIGKSTVADALSGKASSANTERVEQVLRAAVQGG